MNEPMSGGMASTWLDRRETTRFLLMIPGPGGLAVLSPTCDKGRCSIKQQESVLSDAEMGRIVPPSDGVSVQLTSQVDGTGSLEIVPMGALCQLFFNTIFKGYAPFTVFGIFLAAPKT